jgi:hypothetical protein
LPLPHGEFECKKGDACKVEPQPRRRSPSARAARDRAPSPKRRRLSSPRDISDALLRFLDTPPGNLPITEDGYFSMKDIMQVRGHKHSLTMDDVLKAVSHSLFWRDRRGEFRTRFLVYQDDRRGDAIFLRVLAA